jgi:flagellar protein FlaG
MSNDISASRPPQAAATLPPGLTVQAEKAQRPSAVDTPQPAVKAQPDPEEARRMLQEATEHLNKQMQRNGGDLSFSVDDVADRVVVTVKNRAGEVVRQIPNEAALRVAHNLENMKGLFQDDKS